MYNIPDMCIRLHMVWTHHIESYMLVCNQDNQWFDHMMHHMYLEYRSLCASVRCPGWLLLVLQRLGHH